MNKPCKRSNRKESWSDQGTKGKPIWPNFSLQKRGRKAILSEILAEKNIWVLAGLSIKYLLEWFLIKIFLLSYIPQSILFFKYDRFFLENKRHNPLSYFKSQLIIMFNKCIWLSKLIYNINGIQSFKIPKHSAMFKFSNALKESYLYFNEIWVIFLLSNPWCKDYFAV